MLYSVVLKTEFYTSRRVTDISFFSSSRSHVGFNGQVFSDFVEMISELHSFGLGFVCEIFVSVLFSNKTSNPFDFRQVHIKMLNAQPFF